MMTVICKNCGRPFESVRRAKKFCCVACSNAYNSPRREKKVYDHSEKIVWSSGGGVQSTAIAVLICQGKLPKPDLSLMVDCGYESAKTIAYIREVTIPRLAEAGVEFHLVPSTRYAKVELMSWDGHCNLPAFRQNEDGSVSVELHIIVENGVNLVAVSRSIMSEVRYTVSRMTGFEVRNVDVCVDSMRM